MSDPLAAAHRVLDLVQDFDVAGAVGCFAPDGVLDMPNRPGGYPTELRGHEAIGRFIGMLPQMFSTLDLADRVGYRTDVASIAVVEYRGDGTARTGRPYRNRYVSIFRTGPDGALELWREYFDPLVVVEATRRVDAP